MRRTIPNSLLSRSASKPQRGQSTTEFVVLALVLVPLLLILPLLGKYLDLAQSTTLAGRYLAFEGMVRHSSSNHGWKSDAELAQEVRRRFFSRSDAPIKTGDVAGDFDAHRNPLWFDHRGDPLLPRFSDHVAVRTTKTALTQPAGAIHAAPLGLPQGNLYTGEVNVRVADIAGLQPFDAIGLSILRSTTLLADPWAASGPDSIRSRIQGDGGSPVFPYEPLATLAEPIVPLIEQLELLLSGGNSRIKGPEIGRVDPDYVPLDRIR
ncbi:MAG: hypothetical protein KJZ96_16715 [Rhodocyclaceae bacterium]|nr:hypothetical protein [Rhodocyclaceae bacterium]